ncbi:sialate O-acetylesterase [Chitinophaga sp. RAB17]|uniref:sialate O-acetylesterase n=1 Tax=Chitinophaga sp. RAB17 TaxID=3233049 RepID=UPI003F8DF871
MYQYISSRMSKYLFPFFIFLVTAMYGQYAKADVKLPAIFSDGMVLQRNKPVLIWGFGNPGEPISLRIAGQFKTAITDTAGNWTIKLDPLKVGSPLQLIVKGKENQIEIHDILVGEVFLCSGQSNMAMSLDACKRFGNPNAQTDAEQTTLPMVRIFQTPNATFAVQPEKDVSGQWQSLSPDRNLTYSAIAFYFSRSMYRYLKVPIGIIRSSNAGGPIEAKMPLEALLSVECGKNYYDEVIKLSNPEMMKKQWEDILQKWEKEVRDVTAVGQVPPPKPKARNPLNGAYPAADWNGVIAPVIKYTKTAILWYQGEHNVARAFNYRKLLPVLISSWRAESGDSNLPFIFVQLPAFGSITMNDNWALVRESQLVTLKATHHTGMVVTINTGDRRNIHPPDKAIVADRLFKETQHIIYGEHTSGCGPLFDDFKVDGKKIIVKFTHINGSMKFLSGQEAKGFVIAGEDRKFYPAEALINGTTVEVFSPDVPRPVAVRYAWAGFPDVSLFDAFDMPASPFRTDDW